MSTQQRALITGVSGQDGIYPAELLLEKGYEVHRIALRVALPPSWSARIKCSEMVRDMVSFDLDFYSRIQNKETGYQSPAATTFLQIDAADDALQTTTGNL